MLSLSVAPGALLSQNAKLNLWFFRSHPENHTKTYNSTRKSHRTMADTSHTTFKRPHEKVAELQQKELSGSGDSTSNGRIMASTLSERIERLDEETR